MARETERDDVVRDGSLIIDEPATRRDGFVAYEGTTDAADPAPARQTTVESVETVTTSDAPASPAMQAGATILGGTGSTAQVDDAAVAGGSRRAEPVGMSNDNTDRGPISQVREGMTVVDANGDELGKVAFVKMGDPEAVTTAGQGLGAGVDDDVVVGAPAGSASTTSGAGVVEGLGGIFGGGAEPDLPESIRNQMVRVGFIKVDGKGWFDTDYYASADQVAGVAGDTVRLGVSRDALAS